MNPLGVCSACSRPVFQILASHKGSGDDRVDGTPSKIGDPVSDAHLLTLTQVDGRVMRITVHAQCRDLSSSRFKNVWRNIREQEAACSEDAYRIARGGSALPEDQRKADEARLVALVRNPPIGILCAQPWQEIIDGSTRG